MLRCCEVLTCLWVQGIRNLFGLDQEADYNALSTVELDRYLRGYLSDSKLDAVIGAIAQVASESPAEKGAIQLEHLKDKLLNIGQELGCV